MFKKKRYKVKKYKKTKIPFEIYEPARRLELSKENTFPFLIMFSYLFVFLGGLLSFFVSSLLIGIGKIFRMQKDTKTPQRIIKYKDWKRWNQKI